MGYQRDIQRTVDETTVKPLANSDAIYANFVELNTLKKEDLAFDHWEIVEYARGR